LCLIKAFLENGLKSKDIIVAVKNPAFENSVKVAKQSMTLLSFLEEMFHQHVKLLNATRNISIKKKQT